MSVLGCDLASYSAIEQITDSYNCTGTCDYLKMKVRGSKDELLFPWLDAHQDLLNWLLTGSFSSLVSALQTLCIPL